MSVCAQETQPEQPALNLDIPNTPLPDSILNLLSPAPISEDEIIRKLGAPATQIMSVLAELDMTGHIERQPGGLISKAVA